MKCFSYPIDSSLDYTQTSDSQYYRLSEHGRCLLGSENINIRYKCCCVLRLAPVVVTLCGTKAGAWDKGNGKTDSCVGLK